MGSTNEMQNSSTGMRSLAELIRQKNSMKVGVAIKSVSEGTDVDEWQVGPRTSQTV